MLNRQEVTGLINSFREYIFHHYYDQKVADEVCIVLNEKLKKSDYYNLPHDEFVEVVNEDLKSVNGDNHLYIQYLKSTDVREISEWSIYEKETELKLNFGFTRIEILKGNIGYLKINEFMHPRRSMQTAIAAMKLVENTKGLIIDIRGNGGGYPGIMEYILNHFFDGVPIELCRTYYARGKYVTTYSSDLVIGRPRINTPLYILVDKHTASAAEFFAYTLQAHGKAEVFGEKTAGGANRNEYYYCAHGFRLSLSVARPVITVTGTNWEEIGVIPDVESEEDALKIAHEKMELCV